MKNNTNIQSQSRVGFRELLDRVKLQVEYASFGVRDHEQVDELCNIIAEIYLLPGTAPVQIGGNKLTAETVSAFYSALTGDHLQYVIEEFRKIEYRIVRKKSYLRTMLYNAVFEYASAAANDAAQNIG